MSHPPFNKDASCRKCGAKDADKNFRVIGAKYVSFVVGGVFHEQMLRTCHHCGYTWDEAPLDAGEKP